MQWRNVSYEKIHVYLKLLSKLIPLAYQQNFNEGTQPHMITLKLSNYFKISSRIPKMWSKCAFFAQIKNKFLQLY